MYQGQKGQPHHRGKKKGARVTIPFDTEQLGRVEMKFDPKKVNWDTATGDGSIQCLESAQFEIAGEKKVLIRTNRAKGLIIGATDAEHRAFIQQEMNRLGITGSIAAAA